MATVARRMQLPEDDLDLSTAHPMAPTARGAKSYRDAVAFPGPGAAARRGSQDEAVGVVAAEVRRIREPGDRPVHLRAASRSAPTRSRRAARSSATSRMTSEASGRIRGLLRCNFGLDAEDLADHLHDVGDRGFDPRAAFRTRPTTRSAGQSRPRRTAAMVSATWLKSRVGVSRPTCSGSSAGCELRGHGRDHRARRLARPVGVGRVQGDDRYVEAQVVALRELVGGDLGRRVRRLRLERMGFVDSARPCRRPRSLVHGRWLRAASEHVPASRLRSCRGTTAVRDTSTESRSGRRGGRRSMRRR